MFNILSHKVNASPNNAEILLISVRMIIIKERNNKYWQHKGRGTLINYCLGCKLV
jgi:hypothetical protein